MALNYHKKTLGFLCSERLQARTFKIKTCKKDCKEV